MSRWSNELDSPWQEDGDTIFHGYNEKLDRAILPPGYVAKSVNKRMTNGTLMPRKGALMPDANRHWFAQDPIYPVKFIGSFVFNNQAGEERLILVPVGTVPPFNVTQGISTYNFDNDSYTVIGFPPGLVFQENWDIQFAQGFDKLIVLVTGWTKTWLDPVTHKIIHWTNGMTWDGSDGLNTVLVPFDLPTDPTRQVIPPSRWAFPVSNRIAYIANYILNSLLPPFNPNLTHVIYDHVLFSDILQPAQLDPILGDILVNTGENDQIVGLIPYSYDSIVVGMTKSLHLITNFSFPTDFSLTQQQGITAYQGLCGIRAWLQVGQEIFFMSPKLGVFKLSEVLEQRLMQRPLPISDEIQPVIDRINWSIGNIICCAAQDNYLFWAVPLDGSTVNNAILVYNTTTTKWETIDTFDIPLFAIDNLLAIHIAGVRTLLAIQNGPPGLVYQLYVGNVDQAYFEVALGQSKFVPINDLVETRGYGLNPQSGPNGFRNFRRGSITISTLTPDVKVTAITEGVDEERVLRESITKDPTQWYIADQTSFDIQRQGIGDPKRRDYSNPLPPQGPNPPQQSLELFVAQDFSQMPEGPVTGKIIPPLQPHPQFTPPYVTPLQTCRERFPIRMTDRWVSLRIENAQGQCVVKAVSVESIESKRMGTVAA